MADGKAGAPKGNNNAGKGKRMSDRLLKRLEERKVWDGLADALLDKALDGDISSIKEVFDRIDGKAHQSIAIDADVTTTDKKLTAREIALLAKELDSDC